MSRPINSFTYVGNRVPSPEEMLQIIQEQKRFIDNLKIENFKLHQQIAEMESDRSVAHIMGIAQKNAEEIVRKARLEAEGLLETARQRARKTLDELDGYVEQILEAEDSLEGMLGFLQRFHRHMLQADDLRMQEGITAALQSDSAAT